MEVLLPEITNTGRHSFGEDKQYSFQHVKSELSLGLLAVGTWKQKCGSSILSWKEDLGLGSSKTLQWDGQEISKPAWVYTEMCLRHFKPSCLTQTPLYLLQICHQPRFCQTLLFVVSEKINVYEPDFLNYPPNHTTSYDSNVHQEYDLSPLILGWESDTQKEREVG